MVQGNIYLRTMAPIDARNIVIQVKGMEKGKFTEVVYKNNDEGRTERVHEKRKVEKKIYEFTAPCFTFTTNTLIPGDYCVPFAFQLPTTLPSSLCWANKSHDKKPSAKVKYYIKATLHASSHSDEMKHK